MTKQDVQKWLPFWIALFVIPGLAAALIPVRTLIDPTNVALVLGGGRRGGGVLRGPARRGDRRPFGRGLVRLLPHPPVLLVHHQPARGPRHRRVCSWRPAWSSVSSRSGLAGTRHTPPEAAATSPGFMASQSSSPVANRPTTWSWPSANELRSLLALCKIASSTRSMGPDEKPLPVIEPTGAVRYGQVRWATEHIGLPGSRVALPIYSGGHTLRAIPAAADPGTAARLRSPRRCGRPRRSGRCGARRRGARARVRGQLNHRTRRNSMASPAIASRTAGAGGESAAGGRPAAQSVTGHGEIDQVPGDRRIEARALTSVRRVIGRLPREHDRATDLGLQLPASLVRRRRVQRGAHDDDRRRRGDRAVGGDFSGSLAGGNR